MGAPAGETIELHNGNTRALVAPGAGANCCAFVVEGREVIEDPASPENLMAGPAFAGCPILFPFPGRVTDGLFRFEGREYNLPLNLPSERAHAHGFVSRRPWSVVRRDRSSCVCLFDETMLAPDEVVAYPWPFRLMVRWGVSPRVLRADVRVWNPGASDLPLGFGLHPYLRVDREAVVDVPALGA